VLANGELGLSELLFLVRFEGREGLNDGLGGEYGHYLYVVDFLSGCDAEKLERFLPKAIKITG
jgi:hypothetical protein